MPFVCHHFINLQLWGGISKFNVDTSAVCLNLNIPPYVSTDIGLYDSWALFFWPGPNAVTCCSKVRWYLSLIHLYATHTLQEHHLHIYSDLQHTRQLSLVHTSTHTLFAMKHLYTPTFIRLWYWTQILTHNPICQTSTMVRDGKIRTAYVFLSNEVLPCTTFVSVKLIPERYSDPSLSCFVFLFATKNMLEKFTKQI